MRFATTRSKISGRTAKHFANFGNRSAEPYTGGLEDLQPGPARRSFVVAAQCGSRRLFRELLADHRLSKRSIDNRYSLNGRSRRRESNPRPTVYETVALPTELRRRRHKNAHPTDQAFLPLDLWVSILRGE